LKNESFYIDKKILLMDPDGLVRDSMSLFLEDMGCYVKTSSTVKDALQSLLEEAYDVVICAHNMPEMDGLDFLRHIRTIYPNMLKVLEGGENSSMEFFDEARMAGANEIIHKPFTAKDVQEMIGRLNKKYLLLGIINRSAGL
jgi:CheY-like chemotaxis protein